MRQLNLATQSQDGSLTPEKVATATYQAVMASKPVDRGIQSAAAVAVGSGAPSVAVSIAGPYIAVGDPVYATVGRTVNKGTYVYKDTDPLPSVTPFTNSLVLLREAVGGEPVLAADGKEIVAFLQLDTSTDPDETNLVFHKDNRDGTYTATNLPNAISVFYKFRKRFDLEDVDLGESRTFVIGATDVQERADLNQLLKDLYGTGYAFNGTGDAILGANNSVREQITTHLGTVTDAHDATAISFAQATSGLASTNVNAAIEESFGAAKVRLELYSNELRSKGVLEANPLAPASVITGNGTDSYGITDFPYYASGKRFALTTAGVGSVSIAAEADGVYNLKANDSGALSLDQINPTSTEVRIGQITIAGGLITAIDQTWRDITFKVDQQILAHLNATSGAHNAAAIFLVDAANKFTATDVEAGLLELRNAIDAISGGGGALAVLQTEVDAIETAIGTAADGTYNFATGMAATNYLAAITNVLGGLIALDTRTKTNADNIATNTTDISTNATAISNAQTEIDAIETASGGIFQADGTFGTAVLDGGNYMDAATTLAAALLALDTQLKTASDDITNHLADAADAHDASAISVVATGDMISTTVQAALEEHQGDIDALTAALAAMDAATTGDVDTLAFNTGVSKTAQGITYAANNYLVDLAANGTGDDHTEALSKLDAQLYSLAAALGIPIEGEQLTIANDGTATLAHANGMVPGCKPILVLNGSTQTPGVILSGEDFEITADVSGDLRILTLSAATNAAYDDATDTAVIWYRGAIA